MDLLKPPGVSQSSLEQLQRTQDQDQDQVRDERDEEKLTDSDAETLELL